MSDVPPTDIGPVDPGEPSHRFATDYHDPVLCKAVVSGLVGATDGTYVDATLGGGGHTAALLEILNANLVRAGGQFHGAVDELQRVNTVGNRNLLAIDEHGSLGEEHLRGQCEACMEMLGVEAADLIAGSYSDLVGSSRP